MLVCSTALVQSRRQTISAKHLCAFLKNELAMTCQWEPNIQFCTTGSPAQPCWHRIQVKVSYLALCITVLTIYGRAVLANFQTSSLLEMSHIIVSRDRGLSILYGVSVFPSSANPSWPSSQLAVVFLGKENQIWVGSESIRVGKITVEWHETLPTLASQWWCSKPYWL